MSLVPFVVIWCVLAAVVLGLALFRKITSMREDDLIHLGPGEENKIPQQVALFNRLKRVDRWGQTLTVIVAASGLLLGGIYLYRSF